MKLTAAKLITCVTKASLDSLTSLSVLFSMAVLTVLLFWCWIACHTLLEPPGWWRRLRLTLRRPRR